MTSEVFMMLGAVQVFAVDQRQELRMLQVVGPGKAHQG